MKNVELLLLILVIALYNFFDLAEKVYFFALMLAIYLNERR